MDSNHVRGMDYIFTLFASCIFHRSYLLLLSHLLVRYKTFIVEDNKKFSIKVVSSIKIGFENIMLERYDQRGGKPKH